MDASVTQRWVKGRASYRVAGEPISVADYDVVELAKKGGPARDFVVAHHYSGTVPAARRQFGLYHRREETGPPRERLDTRDARALVFCSCSKHRSHPSSRLPSRR